MVHLRLVDHPIIVSPQEENTTVSNLANVARDIQLFGIVKGKSHDPLAQQEKSESNDHVWQTILRLANVHAHLLQRGEWRVGDDHICKLLLCVQSIKDTGLSAAAMIAVTAPMLLPQSPNRFNLGLGSIKIYVNLLSFRWSITLNRSSFSYQPRDTYSPPEIPHPDKFFRNEVPPKSNVTKDIPSSHMMPA